MTKIDELMALADKYARSLADVHEHADVTEEKRVTLEAALKPNLPDGWVSCTVTYEGQHPEEVAYGPPRMMSRLKKWLDKYFAMRVEQATLKPGEPVYAFRRKGLHYFCTCDERRYLEFKNKPHMFEVTVFYTDAPPTQTPIQLDDNEHNYVLTKIRTLAYAWATKAVEFNKTNSKDAYANMIQADAAFISAFKPNAVEMSNRISYFKNLLSTYVEHVWSDGKAGIENATPYTEKCLNELYGILDNMLETVLLTNAETVCIQVVNSTETNKDDLYWQLHSLSKSLEGSGRIDEHSNPDAYSVILSAMNVIQQMK